MEMYCIYTDQNISKEESNEDHIIPLSLGGSNEFITTADKNFNHKIGSEIEGKLCNDFIINMIRSKRNVPGHSKDDTKMIWKKSFLNKDLNKPVQVVFPPDLNQDIKIWDPKTQQYLIKEQTKGVTIQSKFFLDRFVRIKFAAKVALGAGYFVYGDLFRKHIDLSSLRAIINMDFSKVKEADLMNLKISVSDPLTPIPDEDKELVAVFKAMCKRLDTCVIFLLCTENLIITIGILGEWIASLNVPGKTEYFPNDNEYDLGHVISIKQKNIYRSAFREEVARLMEK